MKLVYKQYGLTLIEVMVGILISLILMLGMTRVFIGNREAYVAQNSLQRYQEDMRIANIVLAGTIQNAGAMGIGLIDTGGGVFTDLDGNGFATVGDYSDVIDALIKSEDTVFSDEPIISSPATNNDTVASFPHSLTVRYASRGSLYDCLGGVVGDAATSTIAIVANTFTIDTINKQLECSVNGGPASPLLDNVENMAIRYGLDSDSDGSVDQYVWPDQVADWHDVISVQINLLTVSDSDLKPFGVDAATTYFVDIGADAGAGIVSVADGRLRSEFSVYVPINKRLHTAD